MYRGSCIGCAAWDQLSDDDDRGYCRRFAPTNRRLTVDHIVDWPITLISDWCFDRIENTDDSQLA